MGRRKSWTGDGKLILSSLVEIISISLQHHTLSLPAVGCQG